MDYQPIKFSYKTCWKTRSQEIIPYRKMAEKHLINAYGALEKMIADHYKKYKDLGCACPKPKRLLIAQQAIKDEMKRRKKEVERRRKRKEMRREKWKQRNEMKGKNTDKIIMEAKEE